MKSDWKTRAGDLGRGALQAAQDRKAQWDRDRAPVDPSNWFDRTGQACEELADAVINDPGWTAKVTSVAAGKLAGMAVPAAMFSMAGLVGTASTGAAIGSLSGAAFTSSALAWIGGSVAVGSAVMTGGALIAMIAAPFAVRPLANKLFLGKPRSYDSLSEHEKPLVDACSALALAMRDLSARGQALGPKEARVWCQEALEPLVLRANTHLSEVETWPALQRRSFRAALGDIQAVQGFASALGRQVQPAMTGIGTALVFNLLSDGPHQFTAQEQDILDAMRRSSDALADLNNDALADYVQALTPAQLQGFKNNIKGIAQELRYMRQENADGDIYEARLFASTNHAGTDVQLINTLTGEVQGYQLKATSYGAYVQEHLSRYADVPVLTTSELAQQHGYASSGISNQQLEQDFDQVAQQLGADPATLQAFEAAGLVGVVAVACNVGALLRGEDAGAREAAVKRSFQAGLVAGLTSLII